MSKLSEEARAAAKSKAERLVRSDPHQRVDASGYAPEGALNGNVQTGERPISPRQFRRGGTVAGDAAAPRADRKPRASGGRALTADSYLNRDVKEANEERVGTKHIGGFKRGGKTLGPNASFRAHKDMGGLALPNWADSVSRATGGRAGHSTGCSCAKCSGGRIARATGGKLTAKARDSIKTKNFAGPDRSYPIENESHARNALARASGKPVEAEVRAKVHAKYPGIGKAKARGGAAINDGTRPVAGRLARKGGGRTKKGTNVNIIITQPPSRPPMPPMGAPPGGPPGLRQGMPPGAPPPGAAPPPGMAQGMPPGGAPGVPPAQPLMPRKTGGRTLEKGAGKLVKPGAYPIDAGAGGGLGRLEKAEHPAPRG
jgi:hypothetical protein